MDSLLVLHGMHRHRRAPYRQADTLKRAIYLELIKWCTLINNLIA